MKTLPGLQSWNIVGGPGVPVVDQLHVLQPAVHRPRDQLFCSRMHGVIFEEKTGTRQIVPNCYIKGPQFQIFYLKCCFLT